MSICSSRMRLWIIRALFEERTFWRPMRMGVQMGQGLREAEQLSSMSEFDETSVQLNAVQFKHLIVAALRDLHGEIGAALPVDVLTFEEEILSAILRVQNRSLHFFLHYQEIVENCC
ncbi:ribonuclease P protein subunit p14 isoform X3 [Callorhinchus milii]|uniref:ribonuclease P protein subunit p14 isoform X3 n=1 Tax=Callorhinchus milii TaxID=7868 RepID=UPI000457398A|nr:ribonuclease P protein subunit p14 isoform X3 [Callorhinchus milii]|eukprot:gi/632983831/ref/XP_007908841.1/ PREDICTED: ribonuclease P protein subunit p14 isoform X3 [Callorhinchus milii]